ncbi:MAG: aldo/keto reductase [Myxococcota bacterium]
MKTLDRREFLQQAGAAALGLTGAGLGASSLAAAAPAPPAEGPRIRRYKTLGKTGLRISDIGAGGLSDPKVVRFCFDRGVRSFDTDQMFGSEPVLGEGLKGVRDQVVLTTKYKAGPKAKRRKILRALERSLRSLRTDYVDIYLNHAVNDLARAKNPEWYEAMEIAKRQGKVRFSGMSGHGGNLKECVSWVLEHQLVDVLLCSHNFGTDPAFYERFTKHFDLIANQAGLPPLLEKAHAQGVGVLVMKTLMGAKVNDLSRYSADGASFPRAAFRWVLQNPNVDGLVISMKNLALAEEYIACSGDPWLRQADLDVLDGYYAKHANQYCRAGCDACESACPLEVPIADVLRNRMYAESYGDRTMARRGYAQLGAGASPCLSCASPTCASACPHGLDVPGLTRHAARLLG